jgi:hypothetical protein
MMYYGAMLPSLLSPMFEFIRVNWEWATGLIGIILFLGYWFGTFKTLLKSLIEATKATTSEVAELRKELHGLDSRVNRIEGHLGFDGKKQ